VRSWCKMARRITHVLRAYFKPVAKAWASFVVQTLEGTSCTSEISLSRLHTIVAIMDGSSINVGELIANNIYMFASRSKKALPHLSMICWLCEEAECDLYANDLSAHEILYPNFFSKLNLTCSLH